MAINIAIWSHKMIRQYSIAEARNHLAAIVHDLEASPSIQLTRRGKPVAVLLAIDEYERLVAGTVGFWERYTAFKETVDLAQLNIEPVVFEGLRDRSPGREVAW